MDGFSESIQTRYKKLKKGEKREDHNHDGISVKLKFFKNIHSKDKNSILQFQKVLVFKNSDFCDGNLLFKQLTFFRIEIGFEFPNN